MPATLCKSTDLSGTSSQTQLSRPPGSPAPHAQCHGPPRLPALPANGHVQASSCAKRICQRDASGTESKGRAIGDGLRGPWRGQEGAEFSQQGLQPRTELQSTRSLWGHYFLVRRGSFRRTAAPACFPLTATPLILSYFKHYTRQPTRRAALAKLISRRHRPILTDPELEGAGGSGSAPRGLDKHHSGSLAPNGRQQTDRTARRPPQTESQAWVA